MLLSRGRRPRRGKGSESGRDLRQCQRPEPLFRTLLPARRKSQISPAFPHSRPVRQVRHCRNSSREPLELPLGVYPRDPAPLALRHGRSLDRAPELVAPVHAGYLQAPAVRGRLCDASTCAVDRRPGDGHRWCAQEPPQLGACRPPPSPRASSLSKLSSYAAPVVSPPCERCLPCSPGSRPSQREATASGRPSRH